jgi:hypothetical protein
VVAFQKNPEPFQPKYVPEVAGAAMKVVELAPF